MHKSELNFIVKKFYEALDEGKILGRKCTKCGHVEFPPYLACNECGNLDTEWIDLTNTRAHVVQMLRPLAIFPEVEFREANGGYIPVAVQIDNADPVDTSLVHVPIERWDALHDDLEHLTVKPWIVQGEDTKLVVWVPEDYNGEDEQPAAAVRKDAPEAAVPSASAPAALDVVTEKIIAAAAEAYETDAAAITLGTRVREDLSSESVKLIVLLSNIEDTLGVGIEITEAGEMNTIGDFVKAVKEKLAK